MGSFGDGTLAGFCWGKSVFGFCQSMPVGFCLGGIQLYQGWNTGCDFSWREHWLGSEEGTLVGIYWLRNTLLFLFRGNTTWCLWGGNAVSVLSGREYWLGFDWE